MTSIHSMIAPNGHINLPLLGHHRLEDIGEEAGSVLDVQRMLSSSNWASALAAVAALVLLTDDSGSSQRPRPAAVLAGRG
jgi:hypothetical protein